MTNHLKRPTTNGFGVAGHSSRSAQSRRALRLRVTDGAPSRIITNHRIQSRPITTHYDSSRINTTHPASSRPIRTHHNASTMRLRPSAAPLLACSASVGSIGSFSYRVVPFHLRRLPPRRIALSIAAILVDTIMRWIVSLMHSQTKVANGQKWKQLTPFK